MLIYDDFIEFDEAMATIMKIAKKIENEDLAGELVETVNDQLNIYNQLIEEGYD